MLVGIAQEPGGGFAQSDTRRPVSIRVLVGIAQEQRAVEGRSDGAGGFNPCVSRNSSGAQDEEISAPDPVGFQSVC